MDTVASPVRRSLRNQTTTTSELVGVMLVESEPPLVPPDVPDVTVATIVEIESLTEILIVGEKQKGEF